MTYRNWEDNAKIVEKEYGGQVNWEERFYICPWCGESIYECDWSLLEFDMWICPICEDNEYHHEDDDDFEELEYDFDPYQGAYVFDW